MQLNKNKNTKPKPKPYNDQDDDSSIIDNDDSPFNQIEDNEDDDNENQNDKRSQSSDDSREINNYSDQHQKELEEELLDEVLKEEKRTAKGIVDNNKDKISQELEDKLKSLKLTIKGKDEEQVLNIRMHQLAIAKILVFTHGKSPLILVIAHAHIGQAYINYKCFEQAIDHLSIALKKNKKLFDIKGNKHSNFDTKTYHSHILTSLGKCYFQTGSYPQALEELEKARQYQKGSANDNQISSTKTLTLMANCYAKLEEYKKAINVMDDVLEILKTRTKQNSTQSAMALIEKSKIYALQNQYKEAQQIIQKVIGILTKNQYNKPEFVAQLYGVLAGYQQKREDIDGQQNSLIKIKSIYQSLYSPQDKKVIKIKKQIAIFLFKNQKNKQALTELHQTLDLQQKVYGQASMQVANTSKMIGSIYKKLNELSEAQPYIKRAQKIQQSHKSIDNNRNKLKFSMGIKQKRSAQKPATANNKRQVA